MSYDLSFNISPNMAQQFTEIVLSSTPPAGGMIDMSPFTNLVSFSGNSNRLTSVIGYERCSQLVDLALFNNNISAPSPSFTGNRKLFRLNIRSNNYSGGFPDISQSTGIQFLYMHFNQLSGQLPSFDSNRSLRAFWCYNNQFSGPLPEFAFNNILGNFNCSNNSINGTIPELSGKTIMTDFNCSYNNISNFSGRRMPRTLARFNASNNQLTQTAVDGILGAFVSGNRTSAQGVCSLNVGGSGNSAPSSVGSGFTQQLISRGWTVIVN